MNKKRKVINLLNKNIYASSKEAERKTGIKHIREVCSGKRYSAGGFAWAWLDDFQDGPSL